MRLHAEVFISLLGLLNLWEVKKDETEKGKMNAILKNAYPCFCKVFYTAL